MLIRKIFLVFLIGFAFVGCMSSKSYLDPKYSDVGYEDIKVVDKKYNAKIDIEFQRNGEHISNIDQELRSNVEQIFRASGVLVPSTNNTDIKIKVICNNIADLAEARVKGIGTGLTFGISGSVVTDYYVITVTLNNGKEIISRKYDHAIYTTVGNKKSPIEGVQPTTASNAFNGVIEDVILEFIKEMQARNIFALLGYVNTKKA